MKFQSLMPLLCGGALLACAEPGSGSKAPHDPERVEAPTNGESDGPGGTRDERRPTAPADDGGLSSGRDGASPDQVPGPDLGTPRPARDAGASSAFADGVFVAVGHGGRRLSSCDDGRTWAQEVKVNDSDADHAMWAGMGLAYGEGVFVALFGWGVPTASLLRSEDGVAWQQTFGVGQTGSTATAIAFGDGTFLAIADRSKAHVSKDLGGTWRTVEFGGDAPILRKLIFAGGTFIAFGDNARVVASADQGSTWRNLPIPEVCRGRFDGSVAVGDETILGVGRGGGCRSRDRGVTWTAVSAPSIPGELAWTGKDFYATGLREAYRTVDGEAWTTVKHSLEPNTWVRLVAVSDGGTFVGVDERGDRFFRSADGRSWTRVPAPAGTTVTAMSFGRVHALGVCR